MSEDYIDAIKVGSLGRYINHSDEANAKFIKKFVQGSERCGVFAIQDIHPGNEITCNYGYDLKKS